MIPVLTKSDILETNKPKFSLQIESDGVKVMTIVIITITTITTMNTAIRRLNVVL